MASTIPQSEVDELCRRVSSTRFVNRQLSSICTLNGLRSSGVKLDLQRRIRDYITSNTRDPAAFYIIKQSIDDVEKMGRNAYGPPPPFKTSSPSVSGRVNGNQSAAYHNQAQGYSVPSPSNHYLPGASSYKMPPGPYNSMPLSAHMPVPYPPPPPPCPMLRQPDVQFKPSPFYELLEQLGDVKVLDGMPQHRNSATITIRANDTATLRQCASDPSMRVMLFCAGGDRGPQDIAFPVNSEVKVNDGDIKANMRGLKGKPGSTRPVDITDHLRLRSSNSYANTVVFTYALTEKKFYLMAFVCRSICVETLVQKLTTRKIPKQFVVSELRGKMDDEDVVATSQVLSLKCPISYMRLGVPCRSYTCKHIQCFDATSYLQLQEQGPQWACPICNKPAPYDQLAVDEYVQDILQNTSQSAEQVTIEPDGRWHTGPGEPQASIPASRTSHSRSFENDDVIAIIDDKPSKLSNTPTPSLGTPATGYSREGSSLPKPVNAKRSVIDLTLSSDDEDEPPRPVKKTNYGYSVYDHSNPYT